MQQITMQAEGITRYIASQSHDKQISCGNSTKY
jgi:hypothetical protein